ncbi:MAG TPA: NAD(P)/FAD-dependent oxidoreductase, partial [Thermomicrobiales bacterium]|nr:NAD(P)/FAD-dependent oxidoreductase [Thermomicrobiales bacterium]
MAPPLRRAISPDVAIVGGGVAGSSLAVVLRRAGLDVHLIERSDLFRDRVRGETIHPWGVGHVRELGLYDLVRDSASAQEQRLWQKYVDGEAQEPSRWADNFPKTPNGLGVAHVDLQEALLAEAVRTGAMLHRPAEVAFDRIRDRPRLGITTPDGETSISPALVVGADGEHSATRRWLGGTRRADPTHHYLGGVLVQGLGLATDRIHQALFSGGMILTSPLSEDRARVYIICDPERASTIQRSEIPARQIVDQFRNSTPDGLLAERWHAIGPAGFFPNSTMVATIPSSRDVVLIGDASGRNDPSQGHGLSLVFRDVHALRDLLTDG